MLIRYWYVLFTVLISTSAFSEGFEQRHIGGGAYQPPGDIVLNVQCDVIGKCTLTGEAPAGVNQIRIRGESSQGDIVEANINVGPDRKIQYETARLNPAQWQFEVIGENSTAGTKVVTPVIAPMKVEKPPMPQITKHCYPHSRPKQSIGHCRFTGKVPPIYTKIKFKAVNVRNSSEFNPVAIPVDDGAINWLTTMPVGIWDFSYRSLNEELALDEDGDLGRGIVRSRACPKRRLCGLFICRNGWNRRPCP